MSKKYTYSGKNSRPFLGWIYTNVFSSGMTNKNIQNCEWKDTGDLEVTFDSDLSNDDKNVLDGIANSVPDYVSDDIVFSSTSDDTESSTTSTNYVTKLTLSFKPSFIGSVSLWWNCEIANSNASKIVLVQLVETTTVTTINQVAESIPVANRFFSSSGIKDYFNVTSGTTYNFVLSYAAGSNTAKIRKARILLTRRS